MSERYTPQPRPEDRWINEALLELERLREQRAALRMWISEELARLRDLQTSVAMNGGYAPSVSERERTLREIESRL